MKVKLCVVVVIGMIFTAKVFSQNIPGYMPPNGLVGYWPFDGDFKDYSNYANHAVLTEDINGTIKFVKNFKNEENRAIEFKSINKSWDASSSYIKIRNNNNLNLGNSFTINLYVLISKNNFVGEIINKGPDNQNCFFSRIDENREFKFGSLPNYLNNSIKIDTAIWNMITMVRAENDTSYFYLNGNLIKKQFSSKVLNNTFDIWLGLHQFGSNGSMYPFQGKMDELSIWNRTLTQNEIKNISIGCQKQKATTSSFDKIILKNNTAIILSALPNGGNFKGLGVLNNQLEPSKTKLGKNFVDYIFKNTSGCNDTTRFSYVVYDTLGLTCTKTDTVKVTKTIYDTITTHQTVTDTLKIKVGLTTGLFANQQHLIQMYPNPTASDLLIDFGNQEKMKGYSLVISDLGGKQVYKENIQNQKTTVKLSSLGGKGIYVVNILDGNSKVLVVKQIILE